MQIIQQPNIWFLDFPIHYFHIKFKWGKEKSDYYHAKYFKSIN